MATLTRNVIQTLENDPALYEQTLAEVVALMRQEQQLADRLEAALVKAGFPERSGWVEWREVIDHFRDRASAGFVRSELRRNRRIGIKTPQDLD